MVLTFPDSVDIAVSAKSSAAGSALLRGKTLALTRTQVPTTSSA